MNVNVVVCIFFLLIQTGVTTWLTNARCWANKSHWPSPYLRWCCSSGDKIFKLKLFSSINLVPRVTFRGNEVTATAICGCCFYFTLQWKEISLVSTSVTEEALSALTARVDKPARTHTLPMALFLHLSFLILGQSWRLLTRFSELWASFLRCSPFTFGLDTITICGIGLC